MAMRDLVNRKRPKEELFGNFPIYGPGALVQAFGKTVRAQFTEGEDWVFMLLLDDCNLLNENLTKVLNSAVLKAKGVVAHKLTCLTGLYPTRRTLQISRLVNEHDLETIPVFGQKSGIDMGSPADKDYLKVADAVCRTKIKVAFDQQIARSFDFKRFFGEFKLDELLVAKLRASQNQKAYDLLKTYAAQRRVAPETSITTCWLRYKNVRSVKESPGMDKDALWKKRNASSFTRKWAHVAGIAMCKELKISFPYSGWRVVLHLSGGSIRELLRIMSKAWTLAHLRPIGRKRSLSVPAPIQTQAVMRAAEANYDAVDRKLLSNSGATLQKVCDRLGALFGQCQAFPHILKTPETAAVQLDEGRLSEDEQLNSIISEAVTSGVLLKRVQKNSVSIGLHPSLAPKYGISFRSPFYYPQTVSMSELRHLVLGKDQEAHAVVQEVLRRRLPDKATSRKRDDGTSSSQQLELSILHPP